MVRGPLSCIPIFACITTLTLASEIQSNPDPDEGMAGSVRLGIPEPLVFDLVRPLGAQKGDFEINSLFRRSTREGAPLEWAPEVEFAFRRGTAVEFELPLAGRSLEKYKVALQHTLPMNRSKPFTHGVQGIGEADRSQGGWTATGVYIAGVRWHPQWSSLTMAGALHERKGAGHRQTSPLLNHSVFYERWKRASVGIEANMKLSSRSSTIRDWLMMPQLHLHLFKRMNLQFGLGCGQVRERPAPVVAWRLIREF
jgi:hypothetical protein